MVGTVGRLDFQKAPDHFVEAARRVRDPRVRYVWVGSGELEAEARRLAIRRGLADRMLFTGERDDVPALLPAFDVFAMSSRYEGIPCALAEAMLAGVPAVATAVNGVPEIVVPGETGLLARPGDPVSLARAIEHALARPEERRRWAVEARRLVVDRWAPSELALVLESSYIDAVSHHAVAHSKVLLPFSQRGVAGPGVRGEGRRPPRGVNGGRLSGAGPPLRGAQGQARSTRASSWSWTRSGCSICTK